MLNKHTFSIFHDNLSRLIETSLDSFVEFTDKELSRRIVQILRLKSGEQLTLFDNAINLDLELGAQMFSGKHKICGKTVRIDQNVKILPKITLMPCILRREAFEDVIYAAAQMGVTKIIPVISTKVQKKLGDQKELGRLKNIMIAACEQSKNFVIPELCTPIQIQDISKTCADIHVTIKAYFDPTGHNFFKLLENLTQPANSEIVLLFGPEGGLTGDEERLVKTAGFTIYALTPTILRAKEAVIVGLGGVRSCAKQ
jgi:16S rRNA (uracil1498-N3)-methyltransferase